MLIAIKRFLLLGLIWLALTEAADGGLVVGLGVAMAGTWLSLRLLPPRRSVSWLVLAQMLPGFLWRSVVGGVDVAWRALHPRMPLKPGWLVLPTALPEGGARVALGGEFSLLPGTLVAGTQDGMLLIHCLDVDRAVAADIVHEENQLAAAMGVRLVRSQVDVR